MRSLASGFTFEKLRACLNCIARVASVTAKRANLAEARLRLDLDPTNGCCKATPLRSVPLSSWGTSLSGALGRVTLFSERPERSLPSGHQSAALQLSRWCSPGHLKPLSAIPHSPNSEGLNLFQAGSTIQCDRLAELLEVRMAPPLRISLLLSRGSNPNRSLGSIGGRCLPGDSRIRMSALGH